MTDQPKPPKVFWVTFDIEEKMHVQVPDAYAGDRLAEKYGPVFQVVEKSAYDKLKAALERIAEWPFFFEGKRVVPVKTMRKIARQALGDKFEPQPPEQVDKGLLPDDFFIVSRDGKKYHFRITEDE